MRESLDLERAWTAIIVGLMLLLTGYMAMQLGVIPAVWSDDQATVTISDNGDERLTVDAEVADTYDQRYTGLSEHDSLEPNTGMLFVHWREAERTYVMRGMDFDIDIIFIGADQRVTTIHHAEAPGPGEDGEELQYTGDARWVLEVPAGTVEEAGIVDGDRVEIDTDP